MSTVTTTKGGRTVDAETGEIIAPEPETDGTTTVKKEFFIERQGKKFVLYAGLLDAAHRQGLKDITTTVAQIPTPENGNVAVCHAVVETERGRFTGIGDASPENVAPLMRPHMIRLAETRAKARALRDAVNVSVASIEEIDGDDDGKRGAPAGGQVPGAGVKSARQDRGRTGENESASGTGSLSQVRDAKPEYCPSCKAYTRIQKRSQQDGKLYWACSKDPRNHPKQLIPEAKGTGGTGQLA